MQNTQLDPTIETVSAEEAPDCKVFSPDAQNASPSSLRRYLINKRIFDIVFSLAVLILLSPVYLILALLIVLDDPHAGPIYAQTRVGKDGKPFRFYKFRTMVKDADRMLDSLLDLNEKRDGPAFKIKDDPRLTRVGRFLRKTSLDELPQFFNVLKGDMSVVGPRPPLPHEVAQYSPYHMQRLSVTPGLTCYWQTSQNRDAIQFEDWVEMDLQYIRERSYLLDLKLILLTVKVVTTGQGQ